MSITSKLNEGNKTARPTPEGDRAGFQIANLKDRLAKSERRNEFLETRLRDIDANKRTMQIDDTGIKLRASVNVNGVKFENLTSLKMSENFKSLVPLLSPLVQITNSLIRGNDVLYRRPTMKKDSNGKLTKEPLLDEEGKAVYQRSASDRFQESYENMISDPVISSLLVKIQERLDEISEQSLDGQTDYSPKS